MRRITKNDIAFSFMSLAISLIPAAAIADFTGHKDTARFLLWTSSTSLLGCIGTIPSLKEDLTSIPYQDKKIRDFLADRVHCDFPDHDAEGMVKAGGRYIRRELRLPFDEPIEARHTYLTMYYLIEHGVLSIEDLGEKGIRWVIDGEYMPRYFAAKPKRIGKCFSCAFESGDPYLRCAVNPLHADTRNGCDSFQDSQEPVSLHQFLA